MYVTIGRTPDGRIAAHPITGTATAIDPPHRVGTLYIGPVCPPDTLDRATGSLQAISDTVIVPRRFAATVAATEADPDLVGPVVAVLVHPNIGVLLLLGPFDDRAALDQWWNWPGNRIPRTGIVCLPVSLSHTDQPEPSGGTR